MHISGYDRGYLWGIKLQKFIHKWYNFQVHLDFYSKSYSVFIAVWWNSLLHQLKRFNDVCHGIPVLVNISDSSTVFPFHVFNSLFKLTPLSSHFLMYLPFLCSPYFCPFRPFYVFQFPDKNPNWWMFGIDKFVPFTVET